jgi:hypothetical protein
VSDLIALRAVSPVWDTIGHAKERDPRDLDEVVRVPRDAVLHLHHNDGCVIDDRSTAATMANDLVSAVTR